MMSLKQIGWLSLCSNTACLGGSMALFGTVSGPSQCALQQANEKKKKKNLMVHFVT